MVKMFTLTKLLGSESFTRFGARVRGLTPKVFAFPLPKSAQSSNLLLTAGKG